MKVLYLQKRSWYILMKAMNKMSQTFHNMYRKRLCRGVYREKIRPILINSWEAFCFDVDEEKMSFFGKKSS